MTSGLGARAPTCAALNKSSLWPCHTAFSDSRVNRRFESDTHSGGSSGGGSPAAAAAAAAAGPPASTFFLMHRKSSSQSIAALSRKRGKSSRQAAAWARRCQLLSDHQLEMSGAHRQI
ncbi:hypothetical protein Y1Q_0015084 [Alligator mississippiensis]|uniref:Uncharacterized protein n=1 Tax=Alligator mississippiensis TaxID=8496 RepID=A0A151P8Q4_ALLMI|nr:hypothetical protein Y1Q_0015084 [Alligator mississippiensis]